MSKFLSFSSLLLLLGCSHFALADEQSFFRLGLGVSNLNMQIDDSSVYRKQAQSALIFAEFAATNHSATRFLAYRFDQQGLKLYGAETQLLWGYGLATPGLRLYTGPTAHLEHAHLPQGKHSATLKAFAWQVGLGWQYKNIALDYSFRVRDNHQYNREMKPLGYRVNNVFNHSLLFSIKI